MKLVRRWLPHGFVSISFCCMYLSQIINRLLYGKLLPSGNQLHGLLENPHIVWWFSQLQTSIQFGEFSAMFEDSVRQYPIMIHYVYIYLYTHAFIYLWYGYWMQPRPPESTGHLDVWPTLRKKLCVWFAKARRPTIHIVSRKDFLALSACTVPSLPR